MEIALFISIIGAVASIGVSLTGAVLSNRNNIILQTRKLKEEHYVNFLEALHYLAGDNSSIESVSKYVLSRDKLLLIASEKVVKAMLNYEQKGVGNGSTPERHDHYVTELIKSIRKDLKIVDRNFPVISLKKSTP